MTRSNPKLEFKLRVCHIYAPGTAAETSCISRPGEPIWATAAGRIAAGGDGRAALEPGEPAEGITFKERHSWEMISTAWRATDFST